MELSDILGYVTDATVYVAATGVLYVSSAFFLDGIAQKFSRKLETEEEVKREVEKGMKALGINRYVSVNFNKNLGTLTYNTDPEFTHEGTYLEMYGKSARELYNKGVFRPTNSDGRPVINFTLPTRVCEVWHELYHVKRDIGSHAAPKTIFNAFTIKEPRAMLYSHTGIRL